MVLEEIFSFLFRSVCKNVCLYVNGGLVGWGDGRVGGMEGDCIICVCVCV